MIVTIQAKIRMLLADMPTLGFAPFCVGDQAQR